MRLWREQRGLGGGGVGSHTHSTHAPLRNARARTLHSPACAQAQAATIPNERQEPAPHATPTRRPCARRRRATLVSQGAVDEAAAAARRPPGSSSAAPEEASNVRSSRREAANRGAPESARAAHAESVAELGVFGSACRAGRSRSAAWLPVPRARRVAVTFLARRRRDRPWPHDRPFGAHTSLTRAAPHSA